MSSHTSNKVQEAKLWGSQISSAEGPIHSVGLILKTGRGSASGFAFRFGVWVLFVTNHHVIKSVEEALLCELLFTGLNNRRCYASPEKIVFDLKLARTISKNSAISIYQHPDGVFNVQISNGRIIDVEDFQCFYNASTMPGSSGSLVVHNGQIAAVHSHARNDLGLNVGVPITAVREFLSHTDTMWGEFLNLREARRLISEEKEHTKKKEKSQISQVPRVSVGFVGENPKVRQVEINFDEKSHFDREAFLELSISGHGGKDSNGMVTVNNVDVGGWNHEFITTIVPSSFPTTEKIPPHKEIPFTLAIPPRTLHAGNNIVAFQFQKGAHGIMVWRVSVLL